MKKDTIEQLAKNIENLRRKVIKAKSEEEIKEKFTKKNNWKQFRINVNRIKMILTTDKDFADAVKRGQKIKKQTVYYTVKHLKIGDFVEGKGIYAGVLYDENGENPKSLFVAMKDAPEKMNWSTAMAQDYGQYRLPDIRELTQIHLYKDAINAGLRKNGGEALKDNWYWSSSEGDYFTDYDAWVVRPSDGLMYGYAKYGSYRVRCVLAF